MILNDKQKKLIKGINSGEVYNGFTFIEYIFLNIDQTIIAPCIIDNHLIDPISKIISKEEYVEKKDYHNGFVVFKEKDFISELDNFFVLISILEEEHLIIKISQETEHKQNPCYYIKIVNFDTNKNKEQVERYNMFEKIYCHNQPTIGTPSFNGIKWNASNFLHDFIANKFMTKQEIHNLNNSKNSIRAITIALITSILSIGISLYLGFFPPNEPEKIDYQKIALIYEKIIDDQNTKLISSSVENTSNIENSIEDVEEKINEYNSQLLDEYEKININIEALKIAYEDIIIKSIKENR